MIVGFALFVAAAAHVHHHHHHRHKSGGAEADSGALMGGHESLEEQQAKASHQPVTRRVNRRAHQEEQRVEEEPMPIDSPPEPVDEEASQVRTRLNNIE